MMPKPIQTWNLACLDVLVRHLRRLDTGQERFGTSGCLGDGESMWDARIRKTEHTERLGVRAVGIRDVWMWRRGIWNAWKEPISRAQDGL